MKTRKKHSPIRVLLSWLCALLFIGLPSLPQETGAEADTSPGLLELLNLEPSDESVDYVRNKTQFQLHSLLTEQRHPATRDLSRRIQKDYLEGLMMILEVDEDISRKIQELIEESALLEQLTGAMEEAVLSGRKICFYGCGATGRLAKQMESTFWRPFWSRARNQNLIWEKIEKRLGPGIEDRLIGEMTGADRALISSLEGFEDLQLIGRLQLRDRGIERGDVVVCVTEGGETSSVIGFISEALEQWKREKPFSAETARRSLYFVYNNPDDRLRPFDRSRKILDSAGITKINLTTGPQAITGSTRMQATTIETFVLGHVLQSALDRALREFLSPREMARLGFSKKISLGDSLKQFDTILQEVRAAAPRIARLGELETQTYCDNRFSTYFAQQGLITVFIDSTERSPTFRLFPLDTVQQEARRCWIQVWTPARDLQDAWSAFLGRTFSGLRRDFYQDPFQESISDPYLRRAALESLKNAGNDQQYLYDFSFSEANIRRRGPEPGDLGVGVFLSPEEETLRSKSSPFEAFARLFKQNKARMALIFVSDKSEKKIIRLAGQAGRSGDPHDCLVAVRISRENDPLGVGQQIALKIILNAHSTAVMARLGKVVGNTMTSVSPSNLKLIGRATYLIQSHVNDILRSPQWVESTGIQTPISYGEANAVLFSAVDYLKPGRKGAGQAAEVALSIIHILESLRSGKRIPLNQCLEIVNNTGLARYLSSITGDGK